MPIRPFEKKDAQRCCDIINGCIVDMDGLNEAARKYIMQKNIPSILVKELKSCYTLVFEREGNIIGVGALAGNVIKRVYTDREVQRQGIGTAVLIALESYALPHGYDKLDLDASPSSVHFWRKQGYEELDAGVIQQGDATFHFMKMQKYLR